MCRLRQRFGDHIERKEERAQVAVRRIHRFDVSFNGTSTYAGRWNNRTSADCRILLPEVGLWWALD
jgi:hypothetical protein